MGAREGQYKSYSIETAQQLEDLLANDDFQAAKVIQLVEVHMAKMDAPRALRSQAALVRTPYLLPNIAQSRLQVSKANSEGIE